MRLTVLRVMPGPDGVIVHLASEQASIDVALTPESPDYAWMRTLSPDQEVKVDVSLWVGTLGR
jgi:hypothetical protein